MIPTRIFLDLDDVCNLFTLYALQHVGCPIDPAKGYGQYDPKFGFNIIAAASAYHPTTEFTLASFWNSFDEDVWSDIPVSSELKLLLRNCVALVGRENICILTSPALSPGCAQGKINWIRENLPEWLHQQFLIGPIKHLCARPDALLIDDAEHNTKAFKAQGGQVLLMPRPWNRLRNVDTIEHLGICFWRLLERKRNWRDARRVLVEPQELRFPLW